jgi:maltooligosyltrehalose trehalohydrolase
MTCPFFGAVPEDGGVRFTVMAASSAAAAPRSVQLVIQSGHAAGTHDLHRTDTGVCGCFVEGASAGDRYGYLIDGDLRPDPASRFQPEGVHGPSEVVDARRYVWRDGEWRGRPMSELVVYELHVGTFTPQGTFDAARRQLPQLRDLGVSTIQLMPVADFAGTRNWGYDGVALFAPARVYGAPDDLRAFVDAAHALGLGVMLDVVYNHLGPEGAYLTQFNPCYITERHSTPWGGAVNLDGCGSTVVRRFIIDNAMHWVREYHLDGLRLDATHALIDDSPVHLLAELADEVRRGAPWRVVLHAEDHRNLATLVQPPDNGGFGLDGVWADDYHHIVRRLVAGDSHGYYEDFEGTAEELARTIRQGWLYTGQPSKHMNRCRGTDPSRVPMQRSVVCLQNHDQVGNRAVGDRVHHQIEPAAWRAASALLLTAPMTPLLFMGQEWGASTPFQYFTDLEPGLGRAVTEGRRREFKAFPGFDPRVGIPDPQDEATFLASKLRWEERSEAIHASSLALYTKLLELRMHHPALHATECVAGEAWAAGDAAIVMRRSASTETFLVIVAFRGSNVVAYGDYLPADSVCEVVLTTEDASFARDACPPEISSVTSTVTFHRPGAVVLRTPAR